MVITRDQFNNDNSYYYLTAIENVVVQENDTQYYLKLIFNRLSENYNPELINITYSSNQNSEVLNLDSNLSFKSFEKNLVKNKLDNQITVIFSTKEFPVLVTGSIWNRGKIVTMPSNYLHERRLELPGNIIKLSDFPKPTYQNNFLDFLSPSLWGMKVFEILVGETLYILPVYEAIRGFYCESSSIAESCFHGKEIFNKKIAASHRPSLNLHETDAFIVLEKHIEDDRARLALRFTENENYYYQFRKVNGTIRDKDNVGPLIDFPIDWKTEISFYATTLFKNVVLINYIKSFSDFPTKYTSLCFGRVNDGRKGKNSDSNDLIVVSAPIRVKPLGNVESLPITNYTKPDRGIENVELFSELINIPSSDLEVIKIDKELQTYTRDTSGSSISDGEVTSISTLNASVDGSHSGSLHYNGETKDAEFNFEEVLVLLEKLIKKTFNVTPIKLLNKDGLYKFNADFSKDEKKIRSWCFMKKNNGTYSVIKRKLGIFMFEIKGYYCYIFELELRPTGENSAIGIILSRINFSKTENDSRMEDFKNIIKMKTGCLEKIDRHPMKNVLFSTLRHSENSENLSKNLKNKVDELIKIGV